VDLERRRLVLVRDCFGIKPLYYAAWPGGIAFASELRALRNLPQVHSEIDPQVAYQFLRFCTADDGRTTFYSQIRQVPPASYLEVSLDDPDQRTEGTYWQRPEQVTHGITFEDAAEEVRERFVESVRLHLRSDVPIGAALSGGIDSSAVVAAMRHLEPDMPIRAFCYAPANFRFNEERYARCVADHCNATLSLIDFSSEELANNIDAILDAQEEPIGSASIYAQACVFERARQEGVVVMLDGQGADEMFAGYPRYFGVRLAGMARRAELGKLWHLWRQRKQAGGGQLRPWLMAGEYLFPDAWKRLARRAVGKPLWYDFYNKEWFLERGVREGRLENQEEAETLMDYLWQTLNRTILPQLLHFEDRNSMRVSLESRVPFLNVDLVNYVYTLPDHFLVGDDGTLKRVFRAAMRGLVPDEILDRRDKIGFQPPEHALLQGAGGWIDRVIDEAEAVALPEMIHLGRLRKAWEAVRSQPERVDSAIWRALICVRWMTLQQRR
jgi:asparagine synthase (glutamine-hydrolysing)